MRMQKIIWSLFDSETAVTQGLNSDKYKVYSIGLPSRSAITDNFISIDLSRKSCLKKLRKLPKPDIIFASPPCETWVRVSIGITHYFKRNYNEYNLYWQRNFKGNDFTKRHRELRLLGQKTAYWTYRVIKEFKPKMWVIENGASSLIFKYLFTYFGLQGWSNRATYASYDKSFSLKPTIFFSNYKYNLLYNGNEKSDVLISVNSKMIIKHKVEMMRDGVTDVTLMDYIRSKRKVKGCYATRSMVPIGVYTDMLKHYEHQHALFYC